MMSTIANRVDAPFGDGIRLLGYDLAGDRSAPGESMAADARTGRRTATCGQRYKVFTHLLGDAFNAAGGQLPLGAEPTTNRQPTRGRRPPGAGPR